MSSFPNAFSTADQRCCLEYSWVKSALSRSSGANSCLPSFLGMYSFVVAAGS